MLSGDVHHTYAARVDLPGITGNGTDRAARVHQLTCSPVHNKLHWFIKPAFRLGWSRRIARLTGRWSDHAGVAPVPVRWDKLCGPLFGNMIATLELATARRPCRSRNPARRHRWPSSPDWNSPPHPTRIRSRCAGHRSQVGRGDEPVR